MNPKSRYTWFIGVPSSRHFRSATEASCKYVHYFSVALCAVLIVAHTLMWTNSIGVKKISVSVMVRQHSHSTAMYSFLWGHKQRQQTPDSHTRTHTHRHHWARLMTNLMWSQNPLPNFLCCYPFILLARMIWAKLNLVSQWAPREPEWDFSS